MGVGRPGCLTYLNREEYVKQIGKTTMTDYRPYFKADFLPIHGDNNGETFEYGLQAIKPARFE